MGFFDSKQKQNINETYDNKDLRQYTAAYRGAAPWGFSTLDPTATLAAMGQGTKIGGTDLGLDFKEYLKGLSKEEQAMTKSTNDALERIKTRQESGQFLTPEETNFINTSLDKAFEYAHRTGYQDWEKGTQMLAGSRGLRTSDTPVAQPALQELRNFEVGLGSKRAELGLDATMQLSAQQQQFDQSFAQFNQALQQQQWSTRQGFLFGGGLQAAGNLGYTRNTKGTVTNQMSGYGQVMSGLNMAQGFVDFGKQFGGPMMALGSQGSGSGGGFKGQASGYS
jgi:hypothetical protein